MDSFFRKKGFTILEILITISLFCIAATMGLSISLDVYRSYNFTSEKELILNLLQRARSESLNNIDQYPHGVYLRDGSCTSFTGFNYASRDTSKDLIFPINIDIKFNGLNEIVFSPLASTSAPGSIIISDSSNSSAIIELKYEGEINSR